MNLPEFENIPGAIAIDLDGTLLDSQSQISPRSRAAIRRCVECGIPVIIATSRPTRSVRRLIGDELADICSLVMLNGAITVGNPPLSGYHREILPDEIARGIIDYALGIEPQTTIAIEMDGYKFGVNWTIEPSVLWRQNSATPDMLLSLEAALELEVSKITLGGTEARITEIIGGLKNQHGDSISIVQSSYDNPLLMVTPAQATKPNALRRLLDSSQIPLDNAVAIGDDIPDIEMLRECGISIAMANAIPEVKALCSYQTVGNDDDGVAVVLERIAGIKQEQS